MAVTNQLSLVSGRARQWRVIILGLIPCLSARRRRKRAAYLLPSRLRLERVAFHGSHPHCCCEQQAGHSGQRPSTCNFMWAPGPKMKGEPLPGLCLESRISWRLSWRHLAAPGCQACSPFHRCRSVSRWPEEYPHLTWRILRTSVRSERTTFHTPPKCTRHTSCPEGTSNREAGGKT